MTAGRSRRQIVRDLFHVKHQGMHPGTVRNRPWSVPKWNTTDVFHVEHYFRGMALVITTSRLRRLSTKGKVAVQLIG